MNRRGEGRLESRARGVARFLIWVCALVIAGCGGRNETEPPDRPRSDAGEDAGGTGSGADAGVDSGGVPSDPDAGEGAGGVLIDCDYSGPPLIDVTAYDECSLCDNARCVPLELIEGEYAADLAECEDGNSLCVPEKYLENAGIFTLKSCRSLEDAEGRCMSFCIPEVFFQQDFLPRDVCEADERCAPCYDPFTGEETGACTASCDQGPQEEAAVFDTCCEGAGSCIPESLVDAEFRDKLDGEVCEAGELCSPDAFNQAEGFILQSCVPAGGGEGRCLAECVALVADNAERLIQDDCPDGQLCAPCYDPLSGEATGACHLSNDPGPSDTPFTFPECCGGLAVCAPEEIVPEDQRDLLGRDNCAGADDLCVPRVMADPEAGAPQSCRDGDGAEGRCLPACLPDVAAQGDRLLQAGCDDGQLCAPCYDPLSGEATGACHLSNDPGPSDPPFIFPECCGGLAVCAPEEIVPEDQRDLLGRDNCAGADDLCVPRVMADPEAGAPQSCRGGDGAEGRCLPACLPDVAAQGDRLLQAGCDDGCLCVPCYDPVDGEETGACSTPNDSGPVEDAYEFPECCGGLSVCIPAELISAKDRKLLDRGGCSQPGTLCVPKEMTENDYVPETCSSWNDSEGRCLPACLPLVAAEAKYLNQDSCPHDYLCSPCYDGVTGEQTPACTVGADPGPADPPYLLPECCGGLSVCVPVQSVPVEDRPKLSQDTCDTALEFCVPKAVAEDPERYVPPFCRSWKNAEGRCLPACLPDVADDADRLSRALCDEGHLCSPCYDQITGEETGACSVGGDPGPSEPPVIFERCCGDLAVCVPGVSVPADDRDSVDRNSCSEATDLCVPTGMAVEPSGFVAEQCRSWGNAEGRCLPACLPDIAESADRLARNLCEQDELCVPCYDQITGEETGACSVGGDPGPSEPPVIFERCCGDLAVCVPGVFVPADDRDSVDRNSCSEATDLCVPTGMAVEPSGFVAEQCRSWGNAEGRCLPACLPDIAESADRLTRNLCEQGELCVPCYDQITGELQDTCFAAGDTGPREPPVIFERCCDNRSVCVEQAAIPEKDRINLGPDTCSNQQLLCLPIPLAEDPTGYVAQTCKSWGGAEGRCVFDCLPAVQEVAEYLTPGIISCPANPDLPCTTCEEGDLCAPCYNPFTGELTPVCTAAEDPGPAVPPEQAYTFQKCCDVDGVMIGTCIPRAIAGDQGSSLPNRECPSDPDDAHPDEINDFVCAPDVKILDPSYQFDPCTTSSTLLVRYDGLPGACIRSCFLQGLVLLLGQGDCASDHRCAPCTDPGTGEPTGACS